MATGDERRTGFGAWRAGRGALRVHVLSIFSLAVAFVCLASALLVVSNIAAVRDAWSRPRAASSSLPPHSERQAVVVFVRRDAVRHVDGLPLVEDHHPS